MDEPPACSCAARPDWARCEDDRVMEWPVVELAEWEELRQCPDCGRPWLAVWPEELEGGMILCRPAPPAVRRLRDIDRASTLRAYCLARLEEHYGELRERKLDCRKVGCERKRLSVANYCIEHLIAERFGRHLAKLDAPSTSKKKSERSAAPPRGASGLGVRERSEPDPK